MSGSSPFEVHPSFERFKKLEATKHSPPKKPEISIRVKKRKTQKEKIIMPWPFNNIMLET